VSAADTTVITTKISAALKTRLEALSRGTKRSKSFLTSEAIAAYVELNEWQIGEIEESLTEIESGEAVSEKEAEERYSRLLRPR
jgi:RHH-type transcriptional regulator, rel operon repressor / antitoxin RelB